jgi:NDP-sugar pyrophosphorylase family protein
MSTCSEASATVTASGRLDHPQAHPNLSAMLLAAGHGTRLAPSTDLVPKPLCPIGNTPMIDMALRHASGQTDHTIVNVHGFRDEFER